jgi:hypothetical protein
MSSTGEIIAPVKQLDRQAEKWVKMLDTESGEVYEGSKKTIDVLSALLDMKPDSKKEASKGS